MILFDIWIETNAKFPQIWLYILYYLLWLNQNQPVSNKYQTRKHMYDVSNTFNPFMRVMRWKNFTSHIDPKMDAWYTWADLST